MEVTASDVSQLKFVGLSTGNTGTNSNEIAFSLRFQNGYVEAREKGVYRGDTVATTGDVFRVQVSGGQVSYLKNGTAFYTSAVKPAYPLIVDTSLLSAGSTLSNVVLAGSGSGTSTNPSPTPSPSLQTLKWVNAVNAAWSGGQLQKVGGCDGCPDAGAASQQTLTGDGYVQFTTNKTSGAFVGLSKGTGLTPPANIDFGLAIYSTYVEVRENGVYKSDTTITPGDTLKIAIANGKVAYSKNGTAFYTSTAAPTYPLHVVGTLLAMGSTINDPSIYGN